MTFEDNHAGRDLARERLDGWKTEWERRIKAEKERDEARAGARLAFDRCRDLEAERQKVVDELYRIRADEQPRPLTADDITDEMIDRAYAWWEGNSIAPRTGMRAMLAAALTEPTMTEYTADDFKTARFATHPDGKIAARNWDCDHGPWWAQMPAGNWMGRSDTLMALDGWVPVQEVNR